jgi:hypothetical protein
VVSSSDQSKDGDHEFSLIQTLHPGAPFVFELPSSGKKDAVVEMDISCAKPTAFGTAWGVMLEDVEYVAK